MTPGEIAGALLVILICPLALLALAGLVYAVILGPSARAIDEERGIHEAADRKRKSGRREWKKWNS